MPTQITTVAIKLQTAHTGPSTTANDAVGGDAMASIDVGNSSGDGHDKDSSDTSTQVSADNSSSTPESHTLIRIVLPTEEELIDRALNISGSGTFPRLTTVPEGGFKLEKVGLWLCPEADYSWTLNCYELNEDFSEDTVTYHSPQGNIGDNEWDPDFAADTKIYKNFQDSNAWVSSSTATIAEFDLTNLVKVHKKTFGDKLLLYFATPQGATDHYIASPNNGTSGKRPYYKLDFSCKPPVPKIKVSPDTNGVDGIIDITAPKGDAFLTDGKYHAAWNTSATIAYNQASKSTEFTDTGLESINTNQITGALLDADGTDYYISMFAEDGISVQGYSGQSNIVKITRPTCSAALTNAAGASDYAPEVGEEMTLTITPTASMFSNKVKEFAVNWDSGTSDLDSDYSWYKLDTASSSAYTIKHKFHKVDTFQIKVKVKDQEGWSSDGTATGTANTVVAEPTPIANLSLSKDNVLQSTYLDRTTVVTANLSKSKAIGSNRDIANYLFRYSSGDNGIICTSGAINNDNTTFDDGVGRVSLQVIDAGFDFSDTSFQIYGEAAVTVLGTPVIDTSDDFDHYEYVTEKLFCPATRLTEGTEKRYKEYWEL